MMPTLLVGDLILVNKFHYGVRLPVINKKIVANNDPQRGDVMVFRYPQDPSIDYIKRVVGVPGDEVALPQPEALPSTAKPVPLTPGRRVLRRRYACVTRSSSSRSSARCSTASSLILKRRLFSGPSESRTVSVPRELPLQCRRRGLQGAARATTS